MIVSIHQPAYLPWLGYFDKIARSDIHVFLDNVQLEKRGFTHRNRIKTPQGPQWLTIPLHTHGHRESDISVTLIADDSRWWEKHLKSISQNYCRAPYFSTRFPRLEQLFVESCEDDRLSGLCFRQLRFWLDEFQIPTRIVKASQLSVKGRKSGLMLAYCQELGADTYLSGTLGRNYLQENDFSTGGISVRYQDYVHPVYPQLHGDFVPAMSILDYWFNCSDTGLFGGSK